VKPFAREGNRSHDRKVDPIKEKRRRDAKIIMIASAAAMLLISGSVTARAQDMGSNR
jgi:hypothetical protein